MFGLPAISRSTTGSWGSSECQYHAVTCFPSIQDGSTDSLQEREESGAFEAWLKHKKEQKRREKEEERKRREYDEGWHDKEKDNSQKAFKQFVYFIPILY